LTSKDSPGSLPNTTPAMRSIKIGRMSEH
jgi:hypothetical protein